MSIRTGGSPSSCGPRSYTRQRLRPWNCSRRTSCLSTCAASPRRRWRQIGVRLYRMGELKLQLTAEPRQRRPAAVQRLENDGGTGPDTVADARVGTVRVVGDVSDIHV